MTDETVVTLIMDAAAQPGLTVTRQRLAAVDAAVTVRLGFERVLIPAERFVDQVPFNAIRVLSSAKGIEVVEIPGAETTNITWNSNPRKTRNRDGPRA